MCDTVYSIENIKSILLPVFTKYSVQKAVLFGSYVKGDADAKSDVDLWLDSGLKGLAFVGLTEEIREALDKDVDVLDKAHIFADSRIYSEISKTGVVIYER